MMPRRSRGTAGPPSRETPAAQFNLGFRYANGEGVPQDYVEAHKWLNLAASRGNDEARNNRDIVTKRMTPDQVAEAQRLAREWQSKAG